MTENGIIKQMISLIKEHKEQISQVKIRELDNNKKSTQKDNFVSNAKVLMEEAVQSKKKLNEEDTEKIPEYLVIKKSTPQFGDIRVSQEESIKKTINDNIKFHEDALKYYPKLEDMTLNGEIPTLSLSFQFRFADPSGDGVYIWTKGLQLTDVNARLIGKIMDAFSNWRDSIIQDADLMEKLKRASENNR